ncbi:MAG: GAF domain-containing sensor histidine kinase [Acidimicrobiia bacterium]|nr:GAF domain-containing sensor histidine kinase [Acidimicrobiia bacterium]
MNARRRLPILNQQECSSCFDFLSTFQDIPFSASVQDVPTFFDLMAKTVRHVLDAALVTIWNNNVYGKCLVFLASSPPRSSGDGSLTMNRSTSLTGQAVTDCDVVYRTNLHKPQGNRTLESPQVISKHKIRSSISIPVVDPFDSQFVTCIINIYFDERQEAIELDRRLVDWLSVATAQSLDYLLYRIDEDIRRTVAAHIPTATGIAPLFRHVADDMSRRLTFTSSTLFRVDEDDSLRACASSPTELSPSRYPRTIVRALARSPEEHCLMSKAVGAGKPFMLSNNYIEGRGPDASRSRWNYMAVPVLSITQSVLGVLQCFDEEDVASLRSFSTFDLQILDSYQRAIAPSMERFIRVKTDSPLVRSIQAITAATARSDNLGGGLQQTIDVVARFFNAGAASIYVLEEVKAPEIGRGPTRERLVLRAATGLSAGMLDTGAEYEIGEGLTGDIAVKQIINLKTAQERKGYLKRKAKYKHLVIRTSKYEEWPAFLGVAIHNRNKLVGIFKVEYLEPNDSHPEPYFTDDDEQIAEIIAAFLGFLIEHYRYRERMLEEFKLLAQNSLDIEKALDEHSAIVAVMGALERSGWGDALLSLYNAVDRKLIGYLSSRRSSDIPLGSIRVDLDSDAAHAVALRENRCVVISADGVDVASGARYRVLWGPQQRQYILPLRIEVAGHGFDVEPELIGTLQVIVSSSIEPDEDAGLILQAFAGHLSVALSRTRVLRRAIDLANQVIPSLRFVVAEAMAGMVVHSLGHELNLIIDQLEKLIQRREIRERREILERLQGWDKQLQKGRQALEEALEGVKAQRLGTASTLSVMEDLLQPAIDLWYSLLRDAGCRVSIRKTTTRSLCRLSEHGFREIMSVLLVNAVQAHARAIQIETTRGEQFRASGGALITSAFCLDVSDDGEGLRTDDTEVIFEPTYTTKPEKIGTGLGLYFARRLARSAGGDLFVGKRRGPRGVTFRLVLPTHEEADAQEKPD